MTLVVALACKDGIVLAADSQATVGTSGGPIGQETHKIVNLGDGVIMGAAGEVGMIQRTFELLEHYSGLLNRGLTPALRNQILNDLAAMVEQEKVRFLRSNPEIQMGMGHHEFPGAEVMLVIRQAKDGARKIWIIDSDLTDVFVDTIGKGVAAMGSGDVFALTMLHKYDVSSLELKEGKVLAYKAIVETEGMGAFGVGGRIDMWIMDKGGKVELLGKDAMDEIANAYAVLSKGEVAQISTPEMQAYLQRMDDAQRFRKGTAGKLRKDADDKGAAEKKEDAREKAKAAPVAEKSKA